MNRDLRTLLRAQNRWRWPARLSWAIIFLLVLSILVVMTPSNTYDTYSAWRVLQTQYAVSKVMPFARYVNLLVVLESISVAVFLSTAILIAWRRWDDGVALYISATLLLLAIFQLSSDLSIVRFPAWTLRLAPWLPEVFPALVMGSFVMLFFLFPNGKFVPSWMGWVAGAAVGLIFIVMSPVDSWVNAYMPWLHADESWIASLLFFLFSLVVALAGQIYRYRVVSGPIERQQTKWVIYGLSLPLASMLISALIQPLVAPDAFLAFSEVIERIVFLAIPITIAFSILRYRLWDIDLILNRALVYGSLTAFIATLYILLVGGLSLLLRVSGNGLLTILSTGLIAILFHPLRLRLQQAVNRLMYGDRDDPVTVLAALRQRLETTTTPETMLTTLVETLCHALKLPYAAILLMHEDEWRVTASYGQVTTNVITIPLIFQREQVGRLIAAARGPGEEFGLADHRLLAEVAQHAGAAVQAARLSADLQRSRARLVSTREEERRRLRRDLHDGLGPQLATLSLQVDAARNLLKHDPEAADGQLVKVKRQIQAAIADIPRLVYALRPPALDQLGLVSALREYVAASASNNSPQIILEAPAELPLLPAAVEVAIYRIALEAITNVTRHAQAHHCTVRIGLEDVHTMNGSGDQPLSLWLEICDDGVGLPANYQAGVGLTAMRERVAELGGSCQLDTQPGHGARIRVVLPLRLQAS